jgi:hypothetical protein
MDAINVNGEGEVAHDLLAVGPELVRPCLRCASVVALIESVRLITLRRALLHYISRSPPRRKF